MNYSRWRYKPVLVPKKIYVKFNTGAFDCTTNLFNLAMKQALK